MIDSLVAVRALLCLDGGIACQTCERLFAREIETPRSTLIGGAGSDTATYASAARAVNANLATAVASDGNGGTDSLTTI